MHRRKNAAFHTLVLLFLTSLGVIFFAACEQDSEPPTVSQPQPTQAPDPDMKVGRTPAVAVANTAANEAEDEENSEAPKLADVIRERTPTWGPTFARTYGQKASDFSFTDINGKSHKLSDYVGKDVILVFWATWCPPCRAEIPHLKELRSEIGEDKLALIALSNESEGTVKKFAQKAGMNYTVAGGITRNLPSPFSSVRALPTMIMLDKEGKIKVAAEGMVSLEDVKALLEAQP